MKQEHLSIANPNKMGYVGHDVRKHIDDRNDDWYTPRQWTNLAHDVLNGIDLDPFSSDSANKRVSAKRYFTIDDNAFMQSWDAESVWMNPPYTRGLISKAVNRFVDEFEAGRFNRGIMLVNNMTDTQWYHRAASAATLFSTLTGRIAFENAAGQRISGNTRGQTLFLFCSGGRDGTQFQRRFKSAVKATGSIVTKRV